MAGIGHVGQRGRFHQDAEPREVITARVSDDKPLGHCRAGNPVEAITAGDEHAIQRLLHALVPIVNARRGSIQSFKSQHLCLKDQRVASIHARSDQVLYNLLLPVDLDASARKARQVQMDGAALESHVQTLVHKAFAHHAFAESEVIERVDGS